VALPESPAPLEVLDDARRSFPVGLASAVWDAIAEREPGQRFDRMLAIVEWLIQHLSRLLLSEYDISEGTIDGVEKRLIGLAEGGKEDRLSLGIHLGLIDDCLKGRPEPGTLALFGAFRAASVPDLCRRNARQLELALGQREFGTPSLGIERCLAKNLGTGSGSMSFYAFLECVLRVRNDKAHPDSSVDRDWFKLVNTRLEPAIAEILRWAPLHGVLVGYEVVVAAGRSQRAPEGWTTDVVRDLSKQLVLSGSSSVRSTIALDEGGSWVAARDGVALTSALVPLVDVGPLAQERTSSALTECRRTFFKTVIETGGFNNVGGSALKELVKRRGLNAAKVGSVQKEGWDDVGAASGIAAKPEPERLLARARLCDALEVNDAALGGLLADWRGRVGDLVQARVRQTTDRRFRVVVAEEVAAAVGLPPEVVKDHLSGADGLRSVLVEGGSTWGFFQVAPTDQIRRFREVASLVPSQIDGGKPKWTTEHVLSLMELAYEVLGEEEELSDLNPASLRARLATGLEDAGLTPSTSSTRVRIAGRELTLKGVVAFYGQLFELIGQRADFVESLPWTWGRVRRLADRDKGATADGRHAMTGPVPLPEQAPQVYFDANATPQEVTYCVVQHLCKAGIDASLLIASPPGCIDAASVPADPEGVDPAESAFGIIVDVEASDGGGDEPTVPRVISGATVETFCARLLQFLVTEQNLAFERLPLRLGRSRLLVSLRPDHGRPEVPFAAPVRCGDVFLEAQLTPSEAVPAAIAALKQLDIAARPLREADDDGAEDEESDGPGTWYVNVGGRSWRDMRLHGFWQAGGGSRYRAAVVRLREGDQIYAYISGRGYVGSGVVTGTRADRINEFTTRDLRVLSDCDIEASTRQAIAAATQTPDELAEYAMAVDWRATRTEDGAVRMKGMFTTPLTACRLTHPETLAFLASKLQDGSTESAPGDSADGPRVAVASYGVRPAVAGCGSSRSSSTGYPRDGT
jgi:hypothetical protein